LYFQLALASAQVARKDFNNARQTLAPLLLPNVEEKIRTAATKLMREVD